jgi:hypothetical protein
MAANLLSPSERRERVRAYKDAFPPMGIYAVRHAASGRTWVGASRNVDGMLNRIQFELRTGGHRDVSLAQEWARHGADAFSFEVLERVKERDDPAFDYASELQTMLALWQAELGGALHGGSR